MNLTRCIIAVLAVSVVVNIASSVYIGNMKDKIDMLETAVTDARKDVIALELARRSDIAAITRYSQDAKKTIDTAKQRREELNALPTDATDDDVIRVCRNGLCVTKPQGTADTPTTAPDDTTPAMRAGEPVKGTVSYGK